MDIPLDAKVECADDPCGESVTVIVNPVTKKVTHLVVRDTHSEERLVPIEHVVETTRKVIRLGCTQDELVKMQPFHKKRYVHKQKADHAAFRSTEVGFAYETPYVLHTGGVVTVEEERIPEGERAIHRGTRVEATDGRVGTLGELVVDPASEYISHFVLQKGHLWGKKEITVPVSAIERVVEDTVYLSLDKQAVNQLPAVPIRRL